MLINLIARAEKGKVDGIADHLPDDWTIVTTAAASVLDPPVDGVLPDPVIADLVIIDGALTRAEIGTVAGAIRAGPARSASAPILVIGHDRRAAPIDGVDAVVIADAEPARWVPAIAAWAPSPAISEVRRLAVGFGIEAMAPLVAGFRAQLERAMSRTGGEEAAMTAHRIAGLAGTLGFADVSAAWLRLSRGDDTARHDALRTARIALAAIDRHPEITGG